MQVPQSFDLSGKVAIVTGAARGLGRQMALAFAEAGADVAICDLLAEEGNRTRGESVERAIANTPMKRYGEEAEIKGLAVYLASDASSFMTGSVVVMDGGITIW